MKTRLVLLSIFALAAGLIPHVHAENPPATSASEPPKLDLSDYAGMAPDDALIAAAMNGDLSTARKMIHDGASPNAKTKISGDQIPLSAAAANDHLEMLRFLVSQGAVINDKPDKTSTALTSALAWGNRECIDYLLQQKAAGDPLILAAAQGDTPAIDKYVSGPSPDAKTLNKICEVAAVNGHADILTLALGRLMQFPGHNYWSLWRNFVVQVVAKGHRDVIEVLIDHGESFGRNSVTRLSKALGENPGMRDFLESKGYTAPPYSNGERLIDAADDENLPVMAHLLKEGVDINYRSESSWTPLTKAGVENKVRSVRFLLAHKADPNSIHIPGCDYTALSMTANPDIADMLLAAGANINATLYSGRVHIMSYAVSCGLTKMVAWYVAHGVDPNKVPCGETTFLFQAPNPEIAQILLDHGVPVDKRDSMGETALSRICMYADKPAETARVLLKHGANPNVRDSAGRTPLMLAKDGATVDVLVEYGADLKVVGNGGAGLLEMTGNTADASRLEALIRHGVPFDPKTLGSAMLVRAAWMNQVNVMSFLLDHGVDPNEKGAWNAGAGVFMFPLEAAVTDGQYDAARLLVEHGAKIDDQAVMTALANRRASIVKLFWDHGNRSISGLAYAISQGEPAGEIQKLLDAGAPVDSPQDQIMPPLALAAQLGQLDVVILLVGHGARLDAAGNRALTDAAGEGQDEVVAFLLERGAKPDYSTLVNAVENCHPYPDQQGGTHFEKTVQLLIDAGAAKGLTGDQQVEVLSSCIFTRYPGGNLNVLKVLLNGGVSLNAHTAQGQTIVTIVHAAAQQNAASVQSISEISAYLDQQNKK